jgi:hypothetical protein
MIFMDVKKLLTIYSDGKHTFTWGEHVANGNKSTLQLVTKAAPQSTTCGMVAAGPRSPDAASVRPGPACRRGLASHRSRNQACGVALRSGFQGAAR